MYLLEIEFENDITQEEADGLYESFRRIPEVAIVNKIEWDNDNE